MKIFALPLGCLFFSVALHGSTADHAPATGQPQSVPAEPAAVPATPDASGHPETQAPSSEELISMLRIAEAKFRQQDWESAQLAYNQVLTAGRLVTPDQMRTALLGLARSFRGALRLTQACAVYERYIKDYPGDEQLPAVYLELGRSLRALGADRLALARFYSVLNSTLKLPEQGTATYRQFALTAQFEIAETHFQSGDYEQAFKFYARLRLLDLAPADRARAAFKAAYALNLKNDHEQAVTHLRAYLSLYADGEDAPEARNLLALALRRLGRSQESLATTLDLLKIEQSRTAGAPKTWSYWQRRTGNQLANEFYEQGDILSALSIYQCLRDLGGPSDWLLPVEYQIGLCQERLQQPALARITYRSILDSLQRPAADTGRNPPLLLQDLGTMVAWRLKHLDWLESTEIQSRSLITPAGPDVSSRLPLPAPSVASTP